MNAKPEQPDLLERVDLQPVDAFRTRHHTAVLVVMFTDLKGSTELAEQRGEVYAQNVRQRHDSMLREIVERGGVGEVIKTIGDSLMCVFAQPTAAVERAMEIQHAIKHYNSSHADEFALSVRIGMHMGQVAVENHVQHDVFGRHVNRAARVEALADGGQILLTEPVYDSASGWLSDEGHQWADHGRYQLKGIREPTGIYEVLPPGQSPSKPPGGTVRPSWNWRMLAWSGAAILIALSVWPSVGRHSKPIRTRRLSVFHLCLSRGAST